MDAVTYPDKQVVDFVKQNYIPLKVPYNLQPLSRDFNIKWTPVLITLDADMQEHHRTVGFLDPGAFIASSLLGIGKYHFDLDRFSQALEYFEKILSDHTSSDSTPEAIFLRGVSQYKSSGSPQPLKDAYEILNRTYPENEWTKRAYPYRLL